MSLFKKNSLAVALVGSVVFCVAALQGCSSDEQNTPASAGAGGSRAGSGGKPSTAGTGGEPGSGGGAAGEAPTGTAGEAGETGMGGEGGEGPTADCALSFDNSTLTAFTENGGKLPPLP